MHRFWFAHHPLIWCILLILRISWILGILWDDLWMTPFNMATTKNSAQTKPESQSCHQNQGSMDQMVQQRPGKRIQCTWKPRIGSDQDQKIGRNGPSIPGWSTIYRTSMLLDRDFLKFLTMTTTKGPLFWAYSNTEVNILVWHWPCKVLSLLKIFGPPI